MSGAADLRRLQEIIDASGVAPLIESRLPIGVRPRQLSLRTLLIGILATLADGRPAHLARIHQALICLPEADKWRLGVIASWKSGPHELTYRQTERTFGLVNKTLSKEHPDGQPSQILSEVIDRLLQGSVTVLGTPENSSLAIDWSDYESFARPPRKRRAQATRPDRQPAQNTASAPRNTNGEDTIRQAEAPQQGENEQASCADPEAAWGHRNTNHPGRSETFFGYYLQAATIVKEENGPEAPELVRRVTLSSCKHDPPAQIVPVLARMREDGIPLGDLLADSGYSYREPQTFAMPARALGASLVIDLHPNDRGMKGTHEGAILANGNLYCPATPKTLFELRPPAPAATEQELAAHDQKTEELSRYKLSPLTAADQDGYRRVACPAAKGKLRCPHKPASITLSHKHPTITNPPEHPPPCCAQQTITVPPSVSAKTQQKHDYPSKAHRASYARRSAAERSFSQVCDPASNDTKRGWCRLTGLTGPALFLASAFIVANIRTTDAFTTRQAENEQRAARGLPPKHRRKRRHSLHDLTSQANAPPAITA